MWWKNIYSRINSHGFWLMKSTTKYWQVFSVISKDLVRSERQGGWAFHSYRSSGLPHSSLQTWFHHRAAPPGHCQGAGCFAEVHCSSGCDLLIFGLPQELQTGGKSAVPTASGWKGVCSSAHQQRVPHPRSPFLQLWLLSRGTEWRKSIEFCQPLFMAVGLQVYKAVLSSTFH